MGATDHRARLRRDYGLPFLAAMLAGCLWAGPAVAEDYSVAQSYVHSFSNNVTVLTEVFALNKDVSLRTTGYFKYTVDFINPQIGETEGGEGGVGERDKSAQSRKVAAISSASSAAGSSGPTDVRNELTAGFTHVFGNLISAEAYYDFSQEKDYISNTPTISLKKDLFEKNTTLTLSYSRNEDTVNGLYMTGPEPRHTDNYYFGVTQLLSPTTFVQLGYAGSLVRGYMPEGNRLVPIGATTAADCTEIVRGSCEPEIFPDTRIRNSVIAGLNHYFPDGWLGRSALKLTYRYYRDDWEITSHTEEIEYDRYLTKLAVLGLDFRYYTQTGAFFAQSNFTASDAYRSSTQQLLALDSQLAGIKLSYDFKPLPGRSGRIRPGSLDLKYEYYQDSVNVTAHSVMASLRFAF